MRGAAKWGEGEYVNQYDFYSRASCEARRYQEAWADYRYISTHTPHARRGNNINRVLAVTSISTHAPHARRGKKEREVKNDDLYFYSRASCEARLLANRIARICYKFLLTRLMRGAADRKGNVYGPAINFYSRASCEARLSPQINRHNIARFLLTRLMRGAAD